MRTLATAQIILSMTAMLTAVILPIFDMYFLGEPGLHFMMACLALMLGIAGCDYPKPNNEQWYALSKERQDRLRLNRSYNRAYRSAK